MSIPFQECRKLRNFSSMSTIMMALQSATRASSTSSQLILTRDSKLSKSEKQLLRQLEDILDPLCDHRKYHEALQDIKSSTFTIPWLGMCYLGFSKSRLKYTSILSSSEPSTKPPSSGSLTRLKGLLQHAQRRGDDRSTPSDQLQPLRATAGAHRPSTAIPCLSRVACQASRIARPRMGEEGARGYAERYTARDIRGPRG